MKPEASTVGGWNVFLYAVAVAIIVFFIMPGVFGLQGFNQWGGMYDDYWCHADLFSANPHTVTGAMLRSTRITAGEFRTGRVYGSPTHNPDTCFMWARERCGKAADEGWIVRWVEPILKSQHTLAGANACESEPVDIRSWFSYED